MLKLDARVQSFQNYIYKKNNKSGKNLQLHDFFLKKKDVKVYK